MNNPQKSQNFFGNQCKRINLKSLFKNVSKISSKNGFFSTKNYMNEYKKFHFPNVRNNINNNNSFLSRNISWYNFKSQDNTTESLKILKNKRKRINNDNANKIYDKENSSNLIDEQDIQRYMRLSFFVNIMINFPSTGENINRYIMKKMTILNSYEKIEELLNEKDNEEILIIILEGELHFSKNGIKKKLLQGECIEKNKIDKIFKTSYVQLSYLPIPPLLPMLTLYETQEKEEEEKFFMSLPIFAGKARNCAYIMLTEIIKIPIMGKGRFVGDELENKIKEKLENQMEEEEGYKSKGIVLFEEYKSRRCRSLKLKKEESKECEFENKEHINEEEFIEKRNKESITFLRTQWGRKRSGRIIFNEIIMHKKDDCKEKKDEYNKFNGNKNNYKDKFFKDILRMSTKKVKNNVGNIYNVEVKENNKNKDRIETKEKGEKFENKYNRGLCIIRRGEFTLSLETKQKIKNDVDFLSLDSITKCPSESFSSARKYEIVDSYVKKNEYKIFIIKEGDLIGDFELIYNIKDCMFKAKSNSELNIIYYIAPKVMENYFLPIVYENLKNYVKEKYSLIQNRIRNIKKIKHRTDYIENIDQYRKILNYKISKSPVFGNNENVNRKLHKLKEKYNIHIVNKKDGNSLVDNSVKLNRSNINFLSGSRSIKGGNSKNKFKFNNTFIKESLIKNVSENNIKYEQKIKGVLKKEKEEINMNTLDYFAYIIKQIKYIKNINNKNNSMEEKVKRRLKK